MMRKQQMTRSGSPQNDELLTGRRPDVDARLLQDIANAPEPAATDPEGTPTEQLEMPTLTIRPARSSQSGYAQGPSARL